MTQEYIVETRSGSLYHVTYKKIFFQHGGRFNCRQLVGKTADLSKDDVAIDSFRRDGGPDTKDLDLQHFKVGVQIGMSNGTNTSPILKIFQRIQ